jgi:hypothetical protein
MIEIILALVIGIWIGKTVTNVINQWTFQEILKDLKITDKDLRELRLAKFPEDTAADEVRDEITIRVEQHHGQLYAYRIDTEEFLGQGDSRDTLVARIAERYKGVKFTVPKDQGADLLKNG